jgi:hypothetical protein
MSKLPDRWTVEDIEFLKEKVDEGAMVLVADSNLGIPTIHDMRGAVHCGFGVFVIKRPGFKASFCGGGAMGRTPSGRGWTVLSVDIGTHDYPFDDVRKKLESYLQPDDEQR